MTDDYRSREGTCELAIEHCRAINFEGVRLALIIAVDREFEAVRSSRIIPEHTVGIFIVTSTAIVLQAEGPAKAHQGQLGADESLGGRLGSHSL